MRCEGLGFPTVGGSVHPGCGGGSWCSILLKMVQHLYNIWASILIMNSYRVLVFFKCLLFSIIYNVTVFNRLVEQVRPSCSSHICQFHGTALYSGLLKNISIDHNEWNCWMMESQTGGSLAYKDTVHRCSRVLLFPSSYSPVPNAFYFMLLHPHVNTKNPEHGTLNEQKLFKVSDKEMRTKWGEEEHL